MEAKKQGEELNKISTILFSRAKTAWYCAIIFEIIAGLLAAISIILVKDINHNIVVAIVGFVFLLISYISKLLFENWHDIAETMRRQSVLTEALDWPISNEQFRDWKLRAGQKYVQIAQANNRDENYYETKELVGPKRLLEMTLESVFYTRALYSKVKFWIWLMFFFSIMIFLLIVSLSSIGSALNSIHQKIVFFSFLLLPLVLSIDMFGLALRIEKVNISLKDIEKDLERLQESSEIKIEYVMRIVSEYNCHISKGFPVPDWLFNLWHNEIKKCWDEHGLNIKN